jgi:predicted dehydrogenase
VAVVGAGIFGQNHLRVWRQMESAGHAVQLVALVEPDVQRSAVLAAEYRIPAYQSVRQLLLAQSSLDAASVAVPTVHHAAVASELLSADMDVLVEKPFTATLEEADALIRLARRHSRLIQVGHLERFNPAVRAVRPLLNNPLFFEAHRLSIFTLRSLDVDVVLDLMIHDLDVVHSFVASPVREVRAVGLPVLSSKVDIANVRVEFESGCIANFTASRVSTERVRKLRFFQPHQYISIDYARQDVLTIDVSGRTGSSDQANANVAPSESHSAIRFQPADVQHPTPQLGLRKLEVPPGEPLQLEMESFADCVRQRTQPIVSAEDGRAALALALDILAAIHAHHDRADIHRVLGR